MNPQRFVAAVASLAIGFGITLVGVGVAEDDSTAVPSQRDQGVGGLADGFQEGEQSETSAAQQQATTSPSTEAPSASATTSAGSSSVECATTLAVTLSGDSEPRDLLVEAVFAEGWAGVAETGEFFTVFEVADGEVGANELLLGDGIGNAEARITSSELVERLVEIELDSNENYRSLAFSVECDDDVGEFIVDETPASSSTAFFLPCRDDLRPLFDNLVASSAAAQFVANVTGVTSLDELTDTEIVASGIAGTLESLGGRGVETYLDEVIERSDGLGRFDSGCPASLEDAGDRFDDRRIFLCLAGQLADGERVVEYLMDLDVIGDECSYDAIRIDVDDEEGDG